MITDTNSEDRLVQRTFADFLCDILSWENICAHNKEICGIAGTPVRASERDVVLVLALLLLPKANPANAFSGRRA